VRRIAFLTLAAVLAFAGIAWAVENTVDYTVTIKKASSKKPSAKQPVPVQYTADLTVDTNPPGLQPNVAPTTTVYLAKNLKQNAKYFPSCPASKLEDGTNTFPAACGKAKVGSGTAQALAGSPGEQPGVTEALEVAAYNGPGGKTLNLVVHSTPDAPVALPNRVIPGTLKGGKGAFGYSVEFNIPADLQNQLGLDIALSKFHVVFPSKTITKKIKNKKSKLSYLMLTAPCAGGSMPTEATVQFKDATPVTSSKTASC
jgi:hypothetical protein